MRRALPTSVDEGKLKVEGTGREDVLREKALTITSGSLAYNRNISVYMCAIDGANAVFKIWV
jgi:hypothetical protein